MAIHTISTLGVSLILPTGQKAHQALPLITMAALMIPAINVYLFKLWRKLGQIIDNTNLAHAAKYVFLES